MTRSLPLPSSSTEPCLRPRWVGLNVGLKKNRDQPIRPFGLLITSSNPRPRQPLRTSSAFGGGLPPPQGSPRTIRAARAPTPQPKVRTESATGLPPHHLPANPDLPDARPPSNRSMTYETRSDNATNCCCSRPASSIARGTIRLSELQKYSTNNRKPDAEEGVGGMGRKQSFGSFGCGTAFMPARTAVSASKGNRRLRGDESPTANRC
jgi:hypothetical protein